MTDNTQELDEILVGMSVDCQTAFEYGDTSALPGILAVTTKRVFDWHNKQIEAVLDRLEREINTGRTFTNDYVISEAIEAERNKLKESSND